MDLLWSGGTVGGLVGLIPLMYGIFHARAPFGFLGWIACILGGVAGILVNSAFSVVVSLIIAGLMVFLMIRMDQSR